MKAFLILEDGTIFEGESFGSTEDVICEIVFNTSMTGYLEILTDPSYVGQGVVCTFPLIGNYGIALEDAESEKPWVAAFIVRELANRASNFRNKQTLEEFILENNIPGIQGVDTRGLTRILREKGTMNGMVTCNEKNTCGESFEIVIEKIKTHKILNSVEKVSRKNKIYDTNKKLRPESKAEFTVQKKYRVALLDLGFKFNIVGMLLKRGCEVTTFNCFTKAEEIVAGQFDGIMLSNGPGDPQENIEVIETTKKLTESGIPIFGICLGHQILALAAGGTTYKLKYGHRGANHPVKDLTTGRVYISSQNHGYVVDKDSLNPEVAVVSHINVNDGTVEGIRYINKKVYSVQYHPEACAGPRDSEYLFDEFIELMGGTN